ncbi:hypothetical protein BSQ40_28150 [Serratia fonticola]|nr:hypothetical protein BSQ40_28150 [Serratia fonticola]
MFILLKMHFLAIYSTRTRMIFYNDSTNQRFIRGILIVVLKIRGLMIILKLALPSIIRNNPHKLQEIS